MAHPKSSAAQPLVVVQEPASNFYKDEGGKSNTLQCVVRAPFALSEAVHLHCTLHYESEAIVEDRQADILSVHNPRAVVLGPSATEAVIDFRIEKVSRRKDGQRFRLYIEPDAADVARTRAGLLGVFTEPINVMSKRKTGERVVSRRPAVRPTVDVPDDGTATIKLLHGTLLQMQRTLDDVAKSTKKIERRVTAIETSLTEQGMLSTAPSSASLLRTLAGITNSDGVGSMPSSSPEGRPADDAAPAAAAAASSADPAPAGKPASRAAKAKANAAIAAAAAADTEEDHARVAGLQMSPPVGPSGLQFATNILSGAAPAAAPPLPQAAPALLPGLSHQISAAGDMMNLNNFLPPAASLQGVKRIRSTDMVLDYSLPVSIYHAGTEGSMPMHMAPLTRMLSRQTSDDLGAWFDSMLHAPPAVVEAATSVKRAKMSVVETLGSDGAVSVQVFSDDPAMSAGLRRGVTGSPS